METDPATPETPGESGGLVPLKQKALDFLAGAPPELAEWAQARSEAIRSGADPHLGTPPAEAVAAADLALAEIGEDEDETIGRVRVHTPKNRPEPTQLSTKRTNPWVAVLGVMVVALVVFSVFQLGLPAQPPAGNPTTGTQQQADPAARIAELERKLSANPNDVAANLELGVLMFNMGDMTKAESLWTKVTQIEPKNPQAWFNLGFIHLSKQPPDEAAARTVWQKVIEVAPDSDLARTVTAHLEALAKKSATPTPTTRR